MSSQNVPFGRLYVEATMLRYRNTPRKGGLGETILDAAFLFFAVITVIGSAVRFLDKLPLSVMSISLDSTLVRVVLALIVGYASLIQSVFLLKLAAWLLRRK
jgi:hypothetical protein